MTDFIDPFGAQEFFCNGVFRQNVCTELVRLSFFTHEDGEKILKVKLLMPVAVIWAEQRKLAAFMAAMSVPTLM